MIYEVITQSPMDERWLERDGEIIKAGKGLGRHSFSGAGCGECAGMGRDHGWAVETMDEATALKAALETVESVTVTIREYRMAPVVHTGEILPPGGGLVVDHEGGK